MNIITLCISIIALSLLTTPSYAENEARKLAKLDYISIDRNHDGKVTLAEFQEQASNVFYSMDGNQNDYVSYQEFREWGFGMTNIAENIGKEQAFDTARKVLFDFWDTSYDWQLTQEEKNQGITEDFNRSDRNSDGFLSEEEYLRYSIINIVHRAALKPEEEWQ